MSTAGSAGELDNGAKGIGHTQLHIGGRGLQDEGGSNDSSGGNGAFVLDPQGSGHKLPGQTLEGHAYVVGIVNEELAAAGVSSLQEVRDTVATRRDTRRKCGFMAK